MARENAEIVRAIYEEGLNFIPLLDPDVKWINPPYAVEPGTREGREEVIAAFSKAAEGFESSRYELQELFERGETVVAALTAFATVRGSEVEVRQEEAHSYTFRLGKIVRFEWGHDLTAVLEAAEASE
jgi:ketosteroid isomerase-like protein